MSRWFKVDTMLLADWRVQLLPPRQFKKKFIAALAGKENEFSPYVIPNHGRPSPAEWAKLRASIFERDQFTCQYCGAAGGKLECDHVFPVSRGGSHDPENLKTACFSCNRSKRNKTPDEWMRA